MEHSLSFTAIVQPTINIQLFSPTTSKHTMKSSISALILTFGFLAPMVSQAQEAPKTIEQINQEFSNLPQKSREDYSQKLLKVQTLFNQKRIFDALEKIDELDSIFPNHPAALNIKGACYVEIRAFDKANRIFTEILKSSPNNINVLFNLAEVDFVTKKWASAEKRFEKIIPMMPAQSKAMIRLCEFKLLLCKLKLDKKNEAVAMQDKHDAWDDSPYYYFSRAAIAYYEDDKLKAEKHLRHARYVWNNSAALAAWQDTMIEFGYIRSFYGGDIEAESK